MARKANYEEKINTLKAKIEKKQNEIKALKAKVNALKDEKAKDDYQELMEYMMANKLSAKEVLDYIKA